MPSERVIKIAQDFSETPAGRYKLDGPFTGQHFRDDLLIPALRQFDAVLLILDGVAGLPSSFWEEVMGGLVRSGLSEIEIQSKLTVTTEDSDLDIYIPLAWKFIQEAAKFSKEKN